MSQPRNPRRRSLLIQERSRDTRKNIITAALELWGERGFDTAIDETTVGEIAARAGVSKATFYLHFARKEDILLHTGWLTAEVLYDDAQTAVPSGASVEDIIDDLMVNLCGRVQRVPRPALRRVLQAMNTNIQPKSPADGDHLGFHEAFFLVLSKAQLIDDLPSDVDAAELAALLEALLYVAIRYWAFADGIDLLGLVRGQAAIVMVGARHIGQDGATRHGSRVSRSPRLLEPAPSTPD